MTMDFRLEAEGDVAPESLDAVMSHVESDLRWVDDVFSPYREDSWISRLSRGDCGVGDAPPAVAEVLDLCERFRDETSGAFDARSPSGAIDPTGIVKSWAMERVRWRLGLLGASGWLWGCAGDVVVHGRGPADGGWRVGIADPRGDAAALSSAPMVSTTVLDARASALATSGDAHRPGHIWDPRTGSAATHYTQVSVRGSDLVACDAWATAIVAGGKRTLKLAVDNGIDVMALRTLEGKVHAQSSPGWERARA
ncbi:FAD:protein FMN transferase [Demequina muriae]|uniref:FAD:protein FMN transferase n=1 Tax=Demequina muriae TaxID=3051664 RepID=A0ABT8GDX4_9MICO|nr:FAD:protein FMN transferase [Demequina sp. EGI L300058]MDN4479628.1 FAD:protein FMN transferase [Demequina sp. EGI L300058]